MRFGSFFVGEGGTIVPTIEPPVIVPGEPFPQPPGFPTYDPGLPPPLPGNTPGVTPPPSPGFPPGYGPPPRKPPTPPAAANEPYYEPNVTPIEAGEAADEAFTSRILAELRAGGSLSQETLQFCASNPGFCSEVSGQADRFALGFLARGTALAGELAGGIPLLLQPGSLTDLPPPPGAIIPGINPLAVPLELPPPSSLPGAVPFGSPVIPGVVVFPPGLEPASLPAGAPAPSFLPLPVPSLQPNPYVNPSPFPRPFPLANPLAPPAPLRSPTRAPARPIPLPFAVPPGTDFGRYTSPRSLPPPGLTSIQPGVGPSIGDIQLPDLGPLPEPALDPEQEKCKDKAAKRKCRQGYFRERPGSETTFIEWSTRKCPSSSVPFQ